MCCFVSSCCGATFGRRFPGETEVVEWWPGMGWPNPSPWDRIHGTLVYWPVHGNHKKSSIHVGKYTDDTWILWDLFRAEILPPQCFLTCFVNFVRSVIRDYTFVFVNNGDFDYQPKLMNAGFLNHRRTAFFDFRKSSTDWHRRLRKIHQFFKGRKTCIPLGPRHPWIPWGVLNLQSMGTKTSKNAGKVVGSHDIKPCNIDAVTRINFFKWN